MESIKEMNNKCIIGIYNSYQNSQLVTFDELCFLSKENEHYNLLDYFDRRKSTNLTRFQYCPICGELLNYKELKRKANEIINSRL